MKKLKIFISWSKPRSFVVAEALKGFLGAIFQSVKVLMSEDVEGGKPVLMTLNTMLKEADFAILCLTAENWEEPWIFYEAGVVFGKSDRTPPVCPYIIDLHLQRRNLPEPLKQFRAMKADRSDTFQLVLAINKELDNAVPEAKLKRVFNARWPGLSKVINQPDPRACVEDFKKVSGHVKSHQEDLEPRLRACIEAAIEAVHSNSYDRERIVDLAYREIDANKEEFRHVNSLLVGNVSDFFDALFNKDNLREIVASMESILLHRADPQTMRDRLVERMRAALDEVFRRYHRSLLERLGECLGEGRS